MIVSPIPSHIIPSPRGAFAFHPVDDTGRVARCGAARARGDDAFFPPVHGADTAPTRSVTR
ncbi:hypothetical protein SAMN06295912_13516 [Sphingomonas laterariae]|uniref:Uncharacterized protein n=1 Tax=Edaphosphingomonas laterariae TaxID=861865 RepID=A0A239JLA2_9SPHN|nr:hypothetical protein SAMN06295912_13516 [Sphingomonas laterariae]